MRDYWKGPFAPVNRSTNWIHTMWNSKPFPEFIATEKASSSDVSIMDRIHLRALLRMPTACSTGSYSIRLGAVVSNVRQCQTFGPHLRKSATFVPITAEQWGEEDGRYVMPRVPMPLLNSRHTSRHFHPPSRDLWLESSPVTPIPR